MNFSVSRDLFEVLSLAARWVFAFWALLLALRSLLALLAASRDRRNAVKNLPGSGTVGELVVISGSPELREETWLPVPREGVLGSVRTCDLVVPCPGVRKHHLDFSWQDGAGLLLRPRSGCEALVNGVPLDCRSDPRSAPLTHGSVLTVGSAVLRMMVFAALAPSADLPDSAAQAQPAGFPDPAAAMMPSPGFSDPAAPAHPVSVPPAPPLQSVWYQPAPQQPAQQPMQSLQQPGQPSAAQPGQPYMPQSMPHPVSTQVPPVPDSPVPVPLRESSAAPEKRRRSDRWKEDWSE